MATREDSGTSNYHGLLISVQRRPANGVTLAGNYTWSHCIGDPATANATGRGGAGYLDPNNREFDRGNCASTYMGSNSTGQDRRHVVNLTGVVLSPQFSNPMLRKLGTGWQLSTIYRFATGDFLTVYSGLDRVLSGQTGNQWPRQILASPYLDRDSVHYLNPAAFVQPDIGTIGNIRTANIEGPGYWKLDLGLSRIFQPREGQKLEFRAEAFNVTNTLLKGDPIVTSPQLSLNLTSPTFGQITNSLIPGQPNARIMQFALKYLF